MMKSHFPLRITHLVPRSSGWWSARGSWSALVVGMLLVVGCQTEGSGVKSGGEVSGDDGAPGNEAASSGDGDHPSVGAGASGGDDPVESTKDAFVPDEALFFDPPRGLVAEPISLKITSNISGSRIVYTLDGSKPTSENGSDYTGPIAIDRVVTVRAVVIADGIPASEVQTHTYVLPRAVFEQGDVRPDGDYVFWTTEMDPTIVEDPAYSGVLDEALRSIPTMSIVGPDASLFGVAGIHRGNNLSEDDAPPHSDWVDEVEISLEMFYPSDFPRQNAGGFQTDCGLKIQGGGGKWDNGEYDHKQSFGLRFRKDYGNPSLNYPVFEDAPHHGDSEAGKYDKLILRAGHNKSWGATWDNDRSVYTRDQLGRDLQLDLSGIGARGTFVHLYINGLYWGLYNLTERPDDAHSANYLGGDEDEYYSGKAKGGDVDGDNTRFNYFRDVVSTSGDYPELQRYLAVSEYIDMCLLNVYAATGDFPQYYFGNRFGAEPGPLYFYAWDMEDAFGGGSRRTGDPNVDRLEGCYEFHNMWETFPEFRDEFVVRVDLATAAGGGLSDERVVAVWNALNSYIEDAIVLESARWGDERIEDTGTRYTRDEHWVSARDDVTSDLSGRAQRFLDELKANSHAGVVYYK